MSTSDNWKKESNAWVAANAYVPKTKQAPCLTFLEILHSTVHDNKNKQKSNIEFSVLKLKHENWNCVRTEYTKNNF